MDTEHFYPELSQLFPHTPWLAFDRALNIAARTLCRIGLVWRVDLDPLDWEEGIGQYDLFPPANTRVVQVLELGRLQPLAVQQIHARDPLWRGRVGTPEVYAQTGENQITVYPAPSVDQRSVVIPRVALAPTKEGLRLDDAYAWPYERLLLQGAVASLGGASWPEYEHLCYGARSHAVDGNRVGVPRRVRYGGL